MDGRRLLRAASAVALLVTVGCGVPALPPPGGTTSSSQLAQDTYVRALQMLDEQYVDAVDPIALQSAAQGGVWRRLVGMGAQPQFRLPAQGAAVPEAAVPPDAQFALFEQISGSKLDPLTLAHAMVRAAAESVDDCHTLHMTARQVQEQRERLSGTSRFGGIGVLVRRAGTDFIVVEVFEGGSAAGAGVRRGDAIVRIDGQVTQAMTVEQVVQTIRGDLGSTVRLTFRRRGTAGEFEFALQRREVVAPVVVHREVDQGIGYLRVFSFPETAVAQVDQALGSLLTRDRWALILDLRDNGGGRVDSVHKVASRFVPKGVLFETVRSTGNTEAFSADGSYRLTGKSLIVLTNGGTASGGEILASAIQEHGAGSVVGMPTAGCVSTGQIFLLPDGSGLEIATARVRSGLRGLNLNGLGVRPDVQVDMTVDDLAANADPQMSEALRILASL